MLEICPMTLREANAYVEQHHRHHGPKRAAEFRTKCRETFAAYAELCIENAKGDQQMDYTKGCIDRELSRILGDAAQPWEERYPKEVFG